MNKEDVMKITGLNSKVIDGYIELYPAMLIHEIAEKALDSSDGKLKEVHMELPGIGCINYSKEEGYTFLPIQSFDDNLKNAINKGESPLLELAQKKLVDKINRKYNSLL